MRTPNKNARAEVKRTFRHKRNYRFMKNSIENIPWHTLRMKAINDKYTKFYNEIETMLTEDNLTHKQALDLEELLNDYYSMWAEIRANNIADCNVMETL